MEDFIKYVEQAKLIHEKYVKEAYDEEEALEVSTLILNLQRDLIPSQFVSDSAFSDFWEHYIRPKIILTRFVLKFTSEFRFVSGLNGAQYDNFLEVVAGSCTLAGAKSCLDTTLAERLLPLKDIITLLKDNPWAVSLILISFTPRASRVRK